jgi:hypothetical protein
MLSSKIKLEELMKNPRSDLSMTPFDLISTDASLANTFVKEL